MAGNRITRREFMRDTALAAGAAALASTGFGQQIKKTRSYNPAMEYRRLGKTGLWVSAVCLGGHWKRIGVSGDEFDKNREAVINRCMESGINYVDACVSAEVLAYSKALRGRRDKMYLGWSWYERELRFEEWRTADALLKGFEDGLREAKLEYVDVWRITALESGEHEDKHVDAVVGAFEKAHAKGLARRLGISSHNREWLKRLVEKWPQFEVILTPYTAGSKERPKDSLFESVRKHDVGVFGIKPFSSGSLFREGAGEGGKFTDGDDTLARLAIRYILCNDAITAPIPGMISVHQVDNAVRAVRERRELDLKESAHLRTASEQMFANLPEDYAWLREWEWV